MFGTFLYYLLIIAIILGVYYYFVKLYLSNSYDKRVTSFIPFCCTIFLGVAIIFVPEESFSGYWFFLYTSQVVFTVLIAYCTLWFVLCFTASDEPLIDSVYYLPHKNIRHYSQSVNASAGNKDSDSSNILSHQGNIENAYHPKKTVYLHAHSLGPLRDRRFSNRSILSSHDIKLCNTFTFVFILIPLLDIVAVVTNPLHELYFTQYASSNLIYGNLFFLHILSVTGAFFYVYWVVAKYVLKNAADYPFVRSMAFVAIPYVLHLVYFYLSEAYLHQFILLAYCLTFFPFLYVLYNFKLLRSQRAAFTKALSEITKSSALSGGIIDDAAKLIVGIGGQAMHVHTVSLWKLVEEDTVLRNIMSFRMPEQEYVAFDDFLVAEHNEYKEYIDGVKMDAAVVVNDMQEYHPINQVIRRYIPNACAFIEMPVRIGGKLVGVLSVIHEHSEAFLSSRIWTRAERHFVAALADWSALAIVSAERIELSRRSEEMMNNMPGLIYQYRNDEPVFTIIYASRGNIALTGYEPEELVGESMTKLFSFVHPEDVETLQAAHENTLRMGFPLEAHFRIIAKDGSEKWIWERSRVEQYLPDGTPYIFEGFCTDVTERRRLKAAESANKQKTAFLAAMSHEIRTPMNAIIGLTELALREEDPIIIRDYASAVRQAGINLLGLINGILDFSKIEQGKLEIVAEGYQLASLIKDVVDITRMRSVESKIHFTVNVDSSLPCGFIGDKGKIRQVLLNLLGNAMKFTKAGFVRLDISGKRNVSGQFILCLSVQDSGIGIKAEDIGHVFDAYVQSGEEAKNNKFGGTGLGLAITKRIVEAMDGEIHVSSIRGEGSTFIVTLPQKIQDVAPLCLVIEPEIKSVLIYAGQEELVESLLHTVSNLNVDCETSVNADVFYKKLLQRKWAFVFIAAEVYLEAREILKKVNFAGKIVFLTEFGTSIPDTEITVFSLPAYAIPVADVLNSVEKKYAYAEALPFTPTFIAPEAKVLIVDDFTTNLRVARGLLKPYQMQVHVRKSGIEAIEAVKTTQYDLIFMDHKMPGMDGVETVQRIRSLEEGNVSYNELPIVALTANAIAGVEKMFLEKGFNGFLSKPIDTKTLDNILRIWIAKEKRIETAKNS